MVNRHVFFSIALASLLAPDSQARGKYGFEDKPGGGKDDPVIEVSASIAPNTGATFSMKAKQANAQYGWNSAAGAFGVDQTPPALPRTAQGANQFIRVQFPFKIHQKKVKKTIMKASGAFAATSFLTSNVSITDETGAHVPGIAAIDGKTAQGAKVGSDPAFPTWLDVKGKNQLVGKSSLAYVATVGDQDLSTIAAFGGTAADPETSAINEIRVRVNEVDGVTINGFWVLKVAGFDDPLPAPVLVASIDALSPITPAKSTDGKELVESFSRYVVQFTEPVVPETVGFSANQVKEHNAQNTIPMLYSGNVGPTPNPDDLKFPFFPNLTMIGSPNGVSSFPVPFDVRPINPNNLAEYVVAPLVDLPGSLDLTLTALASAANVNPTSDATITTAPSAVTTLYNVPFNDQTPSASKTFRTKGGGAWTNAPVAPQALYFASLAGGGAGVINLDGNGFETNDPATARVLLVTNAAMMTGCVQPSYLFGCNRNVYGDATGANPIGLAGNPDFQGGATTIPGVNEGSTGSTANGGNPFAIHPAGFETVVKNSKGDARLVRSPIVGSVGDIVIGDFLDKQFFDRNNGKMLTAPHTSFTMGGALPSNSISDPPVPNPPPLRLPVGLPPVDIVFDQQKIKKPAFVIEGDEVFTGAGGDASRRLLLIAGKNGAPDHFPTFAQNGPAYQSHMTPVAYAARQQIGNYMYVTDRDQGVVQVLNSNNFSVLSTIETPDPEALAVSPDLRHLYVTNYGDASVTIIDVDPWSGQFMKKPSTFKVGEGPSSVTVQPENEDVFVTNFLDDTISIFSPAKQTVRRTLKSGLVRPTKVVLTPRYTQSGFFASVYFGYIANSGVGNVPIYESGPSGATGVGADEIRWSVDLPGKLASMGGMIYDTGTAPGSIANLAGGVYVTHQDADTGLAMVSRIHWTAQNPGFGTYAPVPLPSSINNAPGTLQRRFTIVGSWGGPLVSLSQRLNLNGQDQVAYDVALSDVDTKSFFSVAPLAPRTNLGALATAPGAPLSGAWNSKHPQRFVNGGIFSTVASDRMYVSFPGDDRIEVIDPKSAGTRLNTIENVPVVGRLATYFDQ